MVKVLIALMFLAASAQLVSAQGSGKNVKDVGKKMVFSGENIMGELGEIEGVFLFEDDNSMNQGLKVDRSFKEEMKAPEDKENLERKHTEYIKW